ncbi:protein kinase [Streptomyces sp. NPDC013953]|uniref:serine/threonine-protein kinase n=1 Tax=Streptomyces sp. NPDC013953 TaxID=3364868 RepID=UPI0036FAC5DD
MKVRPWQIRPDFRLTAHVVAGRYRLDDLLGRGGAADVYEGVDLRLRRPVAVKVFRPGSDAHTEEQFDRECHLLARLRHPGLVTVYDCGRDDGLPYLVMELIRGTTLRRRIAAAPPALADICRIGSALASALAHVHAAGVVHRDVKPSNILLDEAGSPHLTDFGISQLADTAAPTAGGALVGTAAYMAPEQVEGRAAGPAADIYSLGLVLLECVKGELEYDGTPLEAAIARLHRPPAIPRELPHDIVELLEAMTAADESMRPDAVTCCRILAAGAAATAAADGHGDAAASGHTVAVPRKGQGSGGDTVRSQRTDAAQGGAGPLAAAATSGGPAFPDSPASARSPEFSRSPETFPAREFSHAAESSHALTHSPPSPSPHSPHGPKAAAREAGSLHAARAVTAGAALAALGVALTGLIGSLPADGEDAAARQPRPATTAPLPPEEARPGSSSPSEAPASRPVRRATAPAVSQEVAGQRKSAASERETPAAAGTRDGAGTPPEHAAGGPDRDRPKQSAKGKPAKHKKTN